MPKFEQSVDVARPHTLLPCNPRVAAALPYRYDDTHEEVLVPNIWYNQPWQLRVEAVRFEARRQEEMAEQTRRRPPLFLSPSGLKEIVANYLARATKIHAEADRMESVAIDTHPVAAARLQLDYGLEASA